MQIFNLPITLPVVRGWYTHLLHKPAFRLCGTVFSQCIAWEHRQQSHTSAACPCPACLLSHPSTNTANALTQDTPATSQCIYIKQLVMASQAPCHLAEGLVSPLPSREHGGRHACFEHAMHACAGREMGARKSSRTKATDGGGDGGRGSKFRELKAREAARRAAKTAAAVSACFSGDCACTLTSLAPLLGAHVPCMCQSLLKHTGLMSLSGHTIVQAAEAAVHARRVCICSSAHLCLCLKMSSHFAACACEQGTAEAFGDSPVAASNVVDQASDAAESAVDQGRKAVVTATQDKPKVNMASQNEMQTAC